MSKILEFHVDSEMSVGMPGMKDYLSIRNDEGKREHIQKRPILSNLRELYEHFKERHPGYRVGFSKFATLRPKDCVLAGSSETHTVCVCCMHQNVNLMMLDKCLLIKSLSNNNNDLFYYRVSFSNSNKPTSNTSTAL